MRYPIFILCLLLVSAVNAQTLKKSVFSVSDGNVYPQDIKTDSKNDIIVCGNFWANSFKINNLNLTSKGNLDIFLIKMDANANVLWGMSFGGEQEDNINSLHIDKDDNIIITGEYYGDSISFGDKYLGKTPSSWQSDAYIAKISPTGKVLWAFSYGSINRELGVNVVSDANGDYYFFLSYYSAEIDILGKRLYNTGESNIAILKLDNSGNVIWTKTTQGMSMPNIEASFMDNDNNLYIAGTFNKNKLAYENVVLENNGFKDVFILKIDGSGNVLNSKTFGGKYNDYATDIKIEKDILYVVGGFADSLTIDKHLIVEKGGDDIYLLTLDKNTFNTLSIRSFGGEEEDYASSVQVKNDELFLAVNFKSKEITIDKHSFLNSDNSGWTSDAFFANFNMLKKQDKYKPISISSEKTQSIRKTAKSENNNIIILGENNAEAININSMVRPTNNKKNQMFILLIE